MWNSSDILEKPKHIKIAFMNKLRADWGQAMLATIRCRIFCLPVCFPKNINIREWLLLVAMPPNSSSFLGFLDHPQTTALGRTPLDEWSDRYRDLCLTTHITRNRQTFMPPAGFESLVPKNERLQTYIWDLTATGTSTYTLYRTIISHLLL